MRRTGIALARATAAQLPVDATCFVTFGPDFLHLHLMFALRRGDDGQAEGQTIAFTRKRRGLLGWLASRLLLHFTAIAARYFAYGDTRVFQTIRFRFQNPIAADRAVIAFIRHLEAQPLARWNEQQEAPGPRRPIRLRVAEPLSERSVG